MPKKIKVNTLSPAHARQIDEALAGHFGVDEAGRGCLAGPVCAAAVYVPHGFDFSVFTGLTDSKKTTEQLRLRLEAEIKAHARKSGLAWAIGLSWPDEIDQVNILNATFRAMCRALLCLMKIEDRSIASSGKAERVSGQIAEAPVFIDGPHIIPLPQWQMARLKNSLALPRQYPVVKGDLLVPSISAASILAKVHRDRLMQALSRRYPQYGFSGHKGYGTKEHREALRQHGPCSMHRLSFGAGTEDQQLSLFG